MHRFMLVFSFVNISLSILCGANGFGSLGGWTLWGLLNFAIFIWLTMIPYLEGKSIW